MFIELYKFIQNNVHTNIKQKISNKLTHSRGNRKLKNMKQKHNKIVRMYLKNKSIELRKLKNRLAGDIKRTENRLIGKKRKRIIKTVIKTPNSSKKLKTLKKGFQKIKEKLLYLMNNDGDKITDNKSKSDLLADFFINTVKTLKVKIPDFVKYLEFVEENLKDVPLTKQSIKIIIDLIAYYVPKRDTKGKVIHSIYNDLKNNVLNHFSSPICLLKITHGILTGKIQIDENIKQKIYDINFSEKHKKLVESDVAKPIQLEIDNIAKHIPYNKNRTLNDTLMMSKK